MDPAVNSRGDNSPSKPDGAGEKKPKILLVEDEQVFALDLKRRIEHFGYEVAGIAASGDEALILAHLARPSLILVDVNLVGEMDGVQVAEHLADDLGCAVIFVTGNSDSATLARITATHPFNTILKPVRERELKISLEAALHHSRLQRELQQARDELEARVQERTRELAEANRQLVRQVAEHVKMETHLREARAISEAAARSRTRFFANISHQIRTPMNGIVGMADVLEQTPLSAEQRDCLDVVKDCASSLLRMVDGVIAIANLESGHIELSKNEIHLRDHIVRVLIPAELRAKERGIELTCDIAPEVPRVAYADGPRLTQLLRHLLEFFVEETDSGSVELLVDLISETAHRAHVHFALRSRGLSLAPDVQQRVQRMFDSPEASVRDLEHADFTLTVPALLVPKLQGILWLDGQAPGGTTLHCSLWLPTTPH
ncbi:hypothetical protein DB347_08670 [Opitutaceae bacterium EW11]|nr:hypothetical protein DB347_08670 [Opitutaceae bacterium EW11]